MLADKSREVSFNPTSWTIGTILRGLCKSLLKTRMRVVSRDKVISLSFSLAIQRCSGMFRDVQGCSEWTPFHFLMQKTCFIIRFVPSFTKSLLQTQTALIPNSSHSVKCQQAMLNRSI